LPLISKVDSELAVDLELFSRGGQEILNAIEKQDYAVLGNRPVHFQVPQTRSGRPRRARKTFLGTGKEPPHPRENERG
jgi:hypothetical protein